MTRLELEDMRSVTRDIHIPIPIDLTESGDRRLVAKPVLKNRLIDDAQSLENWVGVTDYIKLEMSNDQPLDGSTCLKATCPTNLPDWLPDRARGRIYAEPGAMRVFDREDWRDWNRLSVWIRPHVPGMKSIVLRVQLYNDGEHKVPDIHMREGAHNVSLEADCWNHVTVEIPHLHRDCVTGVAIEYDMCGHEPDASDTFVWYMDRLELQQVECEVEEGWIPAPDRIAFSGSGYLPTGRKQAVASGITSPTFQVVNQDTGRIVLEKPVQSITGHTGNLQVLDFSEVTEAGQYQLVSGKLSTRAFPISEDIWAPSIWKVLNFFFSQRCGFEVPGKHRACHADLLLKHGEQSIVANGGWHDAADLAQGMANTADGTTALLLLAESLKSKNQRLHARVLEEAKWGLDYTLKVRFGDGFRSAYSSSSIWTDGVIGTADDIVSEPTDAPYGNLVSALAEAIGARVFTDTDPAYAAWCLRIAREDYALAMASWDRLTEGDKNRWAGMPPVALISTACATATTLYQICEEATYKAEAISFAHLLLDCQQKQQTDWEIPLSGFFWQSPEKKVVWHHNHMSQAQYPLVALEALLCVFPAHPDAPAWKAAVARNGAFHLQTSAYTAPYGMVPEGIYHVDEAETHPECIAPLHPQLFHDPDIISKYRQQVEQGIPLGKGWYLRCFPVWFSFRGNGNVQLSQGVNIGIAAKVLNDQKLYDLAQQQLEWIVGKNPFAQSVLYGEGYDWIQQYAVQSGQTIGQLSVGIQSLFDADRPYWPQVSTATYKEVWIETAVKWMWNMVYA